MGFLNVSLHKYVVIIIILIRSYVWLRAHMLGSARHSHNMTYAICNAWNSHKRPHVRYFVEWPEPRPDPCLIHYISIMFILKPKSIEFGLPTFLMSRTASLIATQSSNLITITINTNMLCYTERKKSQLSSHECSENSIHAEVDFGADRSL